MNEVNYRTYRATVAAPEVVQLLKLSALATKGPWKASDRWGDAWYVMGPDLVDERQNILVALWPVHPPEETKAAEITTEANAQFVAALVNWFRSHADALQYIANTLQAHESAAEAK